MTRVPWWEENPQTKTEMVLMGVSSPLSGDSLGELRCVLNRQENTVPKPHTPRFGSARCIPYCKRLSTAEFSVEKLG